MRENIRFLKTSTFQTVQIERRPLLDQVQIFLPQMAQANGKLRKETAVVPPVASIFKT
jgi:hypothetical protein